jgi:DNA-3-methyladenine glycosylase II
MHDLVALPSDYNTKLNFEFLTRSPREILHRLDGNIVYKLFRFGRKNIIIEITPGRTNFRVEYPDKAPNDLERNFLLRYVREWFDLDNDLTPFYELAAKDRVLKPVVAKFRGYRIVGMPDLFESMAWAIIGQQINLGFAHTLKQRFVETFGTSYRFKGETYYLFPSPRDVVRATDEQLLKLQFSRQKSLYIRTLGEAFASGTISKEYIGSLDFHTARQKLMALKGIGNWTANYALMKTFRYKEAFPLEDAGVHNAIKKLKRLETKPTLEEVKKFYKRYAGWEAYATLYLWKSL